MALTQRINALCAMRCCGGMATLHHSVCGWCDCTSVLSWGRSSAAYVSHLNTPLSHFNSHLNSHLSTPLSHLNPPPPLPLGA